MTNIKVTIYLCIICIFTLLFACQTKQDITKEGMKKNTVIQPIKERSGAIAALEEWPIIQEKAQNLYEHLLTHPEDHESMLYLANIYIQEARISGDHPYYYNAALDLLNNIIKGEPQKQQIQFLTLVTKASVLLSQHQFEAAKQVAEKALSINKKDAKVYGVLCDANLELGNYKEAIKMADKMVSIKPDLRSYARISYLRELHGDIEGAIQAMEMAIKAGLPGQESTAWARNTLAEIYLDYGYEEEAKLQLEKCLLERPNFPFAIGNLGAIALKNNDLDKADELISKATQIIPEFSFFITKAQIQKQKGQITDFEKTKQELLVMLEEDTQSGHNMSLELANVYLDLFEDPNAALKVLDAEYKIRPDNLEINKLIGKILFTKGDYTSALKHFEKAKTTNWKNPELAQLKMEASNKNAM